MSLHLDSDMTADNVYHNRDAIIHSQHCIVLKESNLQISRTITRCSSYLLIYSYGIVPNFITSLRLNPIIVLVILHGKLCRALLAKISALPGKKYSYRDIRWARFAIANFII